MKAEYIEIIKTASTVIAAIIGTLIGARLTLRNTIKTLQLQNEQRTKELAAERQLKEREILDSWFEDYAIAECIDPLIAEVLLLQKLINQAEWQRKLKINQVIDAPAIPFDAYARLCTLTGITNFILLSHIGRVVHTPHIGAIFEENALSYLNEILYRLLVIKRLFLDLKIKQKSDIHKICKDELIIYQSDKLIQAVRKTIGAPEEKDERTTLRGMMQKIGNIEIKQIKL